MRSVLLSVLFFLAPLFAKAISSIEEAMAQMYSLRQIQNKVFLTVSVLDTFSLSTQSTLGTTPEERLSVCFHQLAKSIANQTRQSIRLEMEMLESICRTQSKFPRPLRTRKFIANLAWQFLSPRLKQLEREVNLWPLPHIDPSLYLDFDIVSGAIAGFMTNAIEFDLNDWREIHPGLRNFIFEQILEMLLTISKHHNVFSDKEEFWERLFSLGYSASDIAWLSCSTGQTYSLDIRLEPYYFAPEQDYSRSVEFTNFAATINSPDELAALASSIQNLQPGTRMMRFMTQPHVLRAHLRLLQQGQMMLLEQKKKNRLQST